MVQLAPGATPVAFTQLLASVKKSVSPVTTTLLTCNGAPPVLLTVTVGVEFPVPINTLPKLMEAGETDAAGGVTPVPESATETGLLLASLVTVSVAERAASDWGANATWMMQLAPCVIPDPTGQLLFRMEKSASPLMARLLICNGPVPVLLTVIVCDELFAPTG